MRLEQSSNWGKFSYARKVCFRHAPVIVCSTASTHCYVGNCSVTCHTTFLPWQNCHLSFSTKPYLLSMLRITITKNMVLWKYSRLVCNGVISIDVNLLLIREVSDLEIKNKNSAGPKARFQLLWEIIVSTVWITCIYSSFILFVE